MLKKYDAQTTLSNALIFGAGQSGQCAYANLIDSHRIMGFLDNNPVKQGQLLQEVEIYSPDALATLDFEVIYIASEYIESIQKQLTDVYNVPAAKIKTLPSYMTKPMQFADHPGSESLAIQLLQWLCRSFEKANIHYFLDAGTLLGIVRDGALIPWDDDLDIGIPLAELDKTIALLESKIDALQQLTGKQWQLAKIFNSIEFGAIKPGDIRSLKLICVQEQAVLPMVDLFIKYPNGKFADYTLASRGIRIPIEHFQSTETIEFKGVAMKLPAAPELYLESYYGDWRTPKKEWDVGMIKSASSF